jgi:hypothetical protein
MAFIGQASSRPKTGFFQVKVQQFGNTAGGGIFIESLGASDVRTLTLDEE